MPMNNMIEQIKSALRDDIVLNIWVAITNIGRKSSADDVFANVTTILFALNADARLNKKAVRQMVATHWKKLRRKNAISMSQRFLYTVNT